MPRRFGSRGSHQLTPGGQKIRALRERAGLTFQAIETSSDLKLRVGAAHLHKIEVGAIRRPDFETLETILTVVHASFVERRTVLEAFGYKVPMSLPTEEEIDEARRLCAHEMNDATYPIYLIDISQRLLAWNRYVPRLIGRNPDDPTLSQFTGVTLFELMFSPDSEPRLYLDNPEEFIPAWLQLAKTGIELYREEAWYEDLIARARTYPGFSQVWDGLRADVVERFASQSIVPMRVGVPGVGRLQFRISNMNFFIDPRFNMVHYTPFGATAMRVIAQWAEEEGIL